MDEKTKYEVIILKNCEHQRIGIMHKFSLISGLTVCILLSILAIILILYVNIIFGAIVLSFIALIILWIIIFKPLFVELSNEGIKEITCLKKVKKFNKWEDLKEITVIETMHLPGATYLCLNFSEQRVLENYNKIIGDFDFKDLLQEDFVICFINNDKNKKILKQFTQLPIIDRYEIKK